MLVCVVFFLLLEDSLRNPYVPGLLMVGELRDTLPFVYLVAVITYRCKQMLGGPGVKGWGTEPD